MSEIGMANHDIRIGILVGGGPAPGINAVISSATIEAINQGYAVTGIYDGFSYLSSERFDPAVHTHELDIAQVARIHFDGGSVLRTSRATLLDEERLQKSTFVQPDPRKVKQAIKNLEKIGVKYLITIGGDDTMLSARFITETAGNGLRVVHVPKTIDNDLPLPHDTPTFGFSTARYLGTHIVMNLMRDSQTTRRWYLVTAMGRSAGWLAMSIGQAAGATLTLIPEEFGENTTLQRIADVLEGAILKRRAMGRPDGVAIVAEGLAYRLGDREELQHLLGKKVPVDAAGHLRLSEVPLGDLLKKELTDRFAAREESFTMVTHMLGYELRSADPTPADMGYCRFLGHGCLRFLRDPSVPSGILVAVVNGNLIPMSFANLIDPQTNRSRIRLVDVHSDNYLVSRAYMIRLERSDLENPEMLKRLSAEAKMSPQQFHDRYIHAATRLSEQKPVAGAPDQPI